MSTADPYGAQAHARAMAGARVQAMPTVPATSAEPPPGVAAEDLLWEETLAPGGYGAKRLNRGARLRLIDLEGDACASLLVFSAERPVERLNVADTLKVQWNAYLGPMSVLLSDMGKALMSVLEDETEGHDPFCGASNEASNSRRYGEGANHGPCPNARDRFSLGVAKFGLGRKDIHPCINLFKPVRIGSQGEVNLDVGPFRPGRSMVLRADMDVIVVIANCPHVRDPRPGYQVTPLRLSAWRGEPAPVDDPVRISTPERERAFINVEEDLRR